MDKLKILVAEDNKVVQALYKKMLPEKLCERRIAADGEEAMEIYDKWKPDVLLLDYSMPNMNGYSVLKTIRQERKDSAITIIMVSSMSEKEAIVACAKIGIQGYIVKPFTEAELAPKIFQMYRKHQKK